MTDVRAPRLLDLDLTRAVDLSAGQGRLAASIVAADDLSGVSSVTVWFDRSVTVSDSPESLAYETNWQNKPWFTFHEDNAGVRRVMARDVAYASDWNAPGRIYIDRVTLSDHQGNSRSYERADLQKIGLPTFFRLDAPDYSRGGRGDDRIVGTEARNILEGASGDDRLVGLGGRDELDGGAGADTLRGGDGSDRLTDPQGPDRIFGGEGDDWIQSNGRDSRLYGGAGDDQIVGYRAERIVGGDGDDRLTSSRANVVLMGGNGDDLFFFEGALGVVDERADGGIDTVWADGLDRVVLPANVENLTLYWGGRGIGNGLNNVIVGSQFADVLMGLEGNDRISTYSSPSFFEEGDVLVGGLGRDVMVGGAGLDVFRFDSVQDSGSDPATRDVILNFGSGEQLDLGALALSNYVGEARFSETAGEVRFANGVLSADIDGDGAKDFSLALRGVVTLNADNLLL